MSFNPVSVEASLFSFGPQVINQLQLRTIESFLQSGKKANRFPLEVTVFVKKLTLNGKTYPFFRRAEYAFVH